MNPLEISTKSPDEENYIKVDADEGLQIQVEEKEFLGDEELETGHEIGDDEDGGVDTDGLLQCSSDSQTKGNTEEQEMAHPPCCGTRKLGNCTVLSPYLYQKTGFGVVGPHWCGVMCTFAILWGASLYFLIKAASIGPGTEITTAVFTVVCSIALMMTAFSDPGVVTSQLHQQAQRDRRNIDNWRWCDLCRVYQPPKAVHCPDCNLCISGYDHHCPWMGTCVGKKNMKAFTIFNLSWLCFFFFAIFRISIGL